MYYPAIFTKQFPWFLNILQFCSNLIKMVSEKLKMEVTPLYEKSRDSAFDYNEDNDIFYIYNETSLLEERNLVQNWRLALEGILIPCIGLPGIVGKKYPLKRSHCCPVLKMSTIKRVPGLCPFENFD